MAAAVGGGRFDQSRWGRALHQALMGRVFLTWVGGQALDNCWEVPRKEGLDMRLTVLIEINDKMSDGYRGCPISYRVQPMMCDWIHVMSRSWKDLSMIVWKQALMTSIKPQALGPVIKLALVWYLASRVWYLVSQVCSHVL